ncbi:MAG: hypothetical protein KZQ65_09530, partial [Candidatus Thiodiazotropha sp. (ex Gloverina cf. vestifex)]|nr:hypothetical protein [Candidatus Thiodiazotropha sp. (ex Gloverina cf. vestifex)]
MFDSIINWFDRLRFQLSRSDALPLLSVLDLLTGFLAGGVIVLFRLFVEGFQMGMLPGQLPENYEGLPPLLRLVLPIAGGLLLGLVFTRLAKGDQACRYLVKDFGTSESPKSTRQRDSRYAPT